MEQTSEYGTDLVVRPARLFDKYDLSSARRPHKRLTAAVGLVILSLCAIGVTLLFTPVVHSAAELPLVATVVPPIAAHAAATPTAVGTPNPVRLQVGTVAVPAGAISATVPLDLIVLTDRVHVGMVSAAITYDANVLSATGCTQGSALDLLLCNVTTPGTVKLVGVSALGIRQQTTVTELTFVPVQTVDHNTPLTVAIKQLTDGNGTAVGATAVDGSLDLDCAPDAEICERGINIYLPVIRR